MRGVWRSTTRLVAALTICLVVATFVTGLVAYGVSHEALEAQLDRRTADETRAILFESEGRPDRLRRAVRRRDASRTSAGLGVLLADASGHRLAGALSAAAPTKAGYLEFLHYRDEQGRDRTAQALTTRLPNGDRLVVAADRDDIGEIDLVLLAVFATAFGIMLVLGVAATWLVGRIMRSRLARIDRAALAIIGGDMTRRIELSGSRDEFDRVSETLNHMLDRIANLMQNLRQVSSDVAHDLRTPLTRLTNRLDDVSRAVGAEARAAAVAAAQEQAADLLEVFSALLRIADVEGLDPRRHFVALSLRALVADAVETYRPNAELSGHRLKVDLDADVDVVGDRRLLQQLVANLLDNVLRHTPAGTTATIVVSREGDTSSLAFTDDGPGADGPTTSRLFERFSRGEASRSTPGHGLGLALVQAIARAHGGEARHVNGNGFGIVVELPAIKPSGSACPGQLEQADERDAAP